ncbi:MAG: urease accessory protein UreE [Silicimonas sp.]|jgi:urease accessory protein|nr:urease accessory protein UreE [Silicimonas sp.]
MTQPVAHSLRAAGDWSEAADRCVLTYDDRFLRRKRLTGEGGLSFVCDLEKTTSLNAGEAFELTDGRFVEIAAAAEPLYRVTGPDLARLAWHVGNRHTPCQIEAGALLIQRDKVIGHMLEHLGAKLVEVEEPFTPEGGAYGHGRTHSHEHGATAHAH